MVTTELAEKIKRLAFIAAASLLAELTEKELKQVRSVILFGSVSQGTATKGSDIDLFFDVDMPHSRQKALRAKLNRLAEQLYLSHAALRFKMEGIENELAITVGNIAEWQELGRAIASTGLVLYGKYLEYKPTGLTPCIILSWEKIPLKVKGAFLNKIYGYKVGMKHYAGMIEKFHAQRLGRATILVPKEYEDNFTAVLERYKVDYSAREIWS